MRTPEAERASLYKDPAIWIEWPLEPMTASQKDAAAPLLSEAEHNFLYTPPS